MPELLGDHGCVHAGVQERYRAGVMERVRRELLALRAWVSVLGEVGVFGEQPLDALRLSGSL